MEICAGLAFACLVVMTGKAETEAVSSTGQWFGVYVPHLDALGITPLASEVFPSPISLLMNVVRWCVVPLIRANDVYVLG